MNGRKQELGRTVASLLALVLVLVLTSASVGGTPLAQRTARTQIRWRRKRDRTAMPSPTRDN